MTDDDSDTKKITHHVDDLLQRDAEFHLERLALIGDRSL